MAQYDHVIRGANIADGSGGDIFAADVGIFDGRIEAVGKIRDRGLVETEADGLLLTPGFVDIHTHYDGQITWEERLMPSSNHGVTTVVMGNCGVGFAPCRPENRELLIKVMEGVEDIPEIVMAEGLPWNWESFPEYLASLESRCSDIDFAAQVPHAAVRVHVMGARGADEEKPRADELEQMSSLVAEGIRAGALGVTTSRSIGHRTVEGRLAPTVRADETELHALAHGLRRAGSGVFQLIGTQEEHDPAEEVAMYRRITEISGRPLSFSLLHSHQFPDYAAKYLKALNEINRPGLPAIRGQVFPRPVGIILGLDLSFHPFRFNRSYLEIAHLPLAERVVKMRDPAVRRKILAEVPEHTNPTMQHFASQDAELFRMDIAPDYEPDEDDKVGALAKARGQSPRELIYDWMVESDGQVNFLLPITNFAGGTLETVQALLENEYTLVGLGDGGAHYGMISDSSYTTSLLAMWTRDRTKGGRISLARAVRMLTRPNALAVGLDDRGLIAPGMKADINLIDYDRLQLHRPEATWDLPAGGRRLIQGATGYEMTMVSGVVTYRQGVHTGKLPGRLLRNPASDRAAVL